MNLVLNLEDVDYHYVMGRDVEWRLGLMIFKKYNIKCEGFIK